MNKVLQNPKPNIYRQYSLNKREEFNRKKVEDDNDQQDQLDSLQIFQLIRNINDPEYPLTLEQLNVLNLERVFVDNEKRSIQIKFTPTVPHCSMAQMIGLMIKIKLTRSVSSCYKNEILITEGTHSNQKQINKQLNDKERVAAAIENNNILRIVKKGIANTDKKPN